MCFRPDAFQQQEDARVFVATTQAAGVGLTLTAATYVFFALLPWTPALLRQAEDRAHRHGQENSVNIIRPMIPQTIDEGVRALLAQKEEISASVVKERLCRSVS